MIDGEGLQGLIQSRKLFMLKPTIVMGVLFNYQTLRDKTWPVFERFTQCCKLDSRLWAAHVPLHLTSHVLVRLWIIESENSQAAVKNCSQVPGNVDHLQETSPIGYSKAGVFRIH